ncbi:MAG: hypothetical protein MJ134_10240 [Lachnospiraceae bacterium]|nr:hypothetical protein [Lachnospiraceae bacterium]
MINFEEELKKFHYSLELEEAEDALYQNSMIDVSDLVIKVLKEAKDETEES